MYILKNAWVSISRNNGRNILIAIIVTVIVDACAVTLSIKNSAEKIVASYEDKYQVEVTIGMDRSTLQDFMKDAAKDRSLSYNPKMIIAEEPTGNLDKETEDEIMNIFKDLAHKQGKCVIIVTHSKNVADNCDVVYELKANKK